MTIDTFESDPRGTHADPAPFAAGIESFIRQPASDALAPVSYLFPVDEIDLDDNLMYSPEKATEIALQLLRQCNGEVTPKLSRIALKNAALPLYAMRLAGPAVTTEEINAVIAIPTVTTSVLEAYGNLIGDKDVEQDALRQAIYDTVVFHLASKVLVDRAPDSFYLLPTTTQLFKPGAGSTAAVTFDVHKTDSFAADARLVMSDDASVDSLLDRDYTRNTIHLRPSKLTTEFMTLVETIVTNPTDEANPVIEQATDSLTRAVDDHFKRQNERR